MPPCAARIVAAGTDDLEQGGAISPLLENSGKSRERRGDVLEKSRAAFAGAELRERPDRLQEPICGVSQKDPAPDVHRPLIGRIRESGYARGDGSSQIRIDQVPADTGVHLDIRIIEQSGQVVFGRPFARALEIDDCESVSSEHEIARLKITMHEDRAI